MGLMKFGAQLKEKAKVKSLTKEKVKKLIPRIRKQLEQRAEDGFNHAVLQLPITDDEWNFIIDWAIEEEIGCKKEDIEKKEFRFMW